MANDKPTNIQFIQHRLPPLEAGEYELKLSQTISVLQQPDSKDLQKLDTFAHTQKFIVQGPRFSLPAGAVVKTFPPKESTGEYGHVLPHIVLQSRTLPWEREVMKDGEHPDKGAAWLALLVFDQTDADFYYPPKKENGSEQTKKEHGAYGRAQVGKVKDLLTTDDTKIFSPLADATLNTDQKREDPCRFIDVPKGLFAEIAPTKDDLPWLSHVQKHKDSHHSVETSVIMANRLPKEGSMTVVHLVSLEGMGEYLPNEQGTLTGIPESAEYIRLVSLHNWSFNPELVKIHFAAYLEHLNQPLKGAGANATDGLFRVPPPYSDHEHIQAKMSAGYVPLRYRLRNGEQEAAWYRGPFSPQRVNTQVYFEKDGPFGMAARISEGIDKYKEATEPGEQSTSLAEDISNFLRKTGMGLPARSADSLLLFSNNTGLCTASYAAAWQLGRLLALADEAFSTGLYQWKTNQIRKAMVELRQNKNLGSTRKRGDFYKVILRMHNEGLLQAGTAPELPENLKNWLADLLLLRKVPFHYLVPDAKILPKESLKFFCLDINWLACLFDGAFSIGRSTATQWEHDQAYLKDYFKKVLEQAGFATTDPQQLVVSGFIWRSAAVKGWDPGIEAEAFATAEEKEALSCPRWENLAPDTKLALFNGELKRLIIHEPALGTHFGIDPIPDENGKYTKGLRYLAGDDKGQLNSVQAVVPKITEERDVLGVSKLANNISLAFTSADFTRQLIKVIKEKLDTPSSPKTTDELTSLLSEAVKTIQPEDSSYDAVKMVTQMMKAVGLKLQKLNGEPSLTTTDFSLYLNESVQVDLQDIKLDPRPLTAVQLSQKIIGAAASKLEKLKNDAPPFTAADFALQMIEGVEGARFVLNNANS